MGKTILPFFMNVGCFGKFVNKIVVTISCVQLAKYICSGLALQTNG